MINSLLNINSKSTFWVLASLYGFVSTFFIANFYSWGLGASYQSLFAAVLLLAPVFGTASFYLNAFLLRSVGKLLGGVGSLNDYVNAVALSKSPYVVSAVMWILLAVTQPDMVFIHYATSTSAVAIILISSFINFTAFALLVRSIRGIEGFSMGRAFFNVVISFFLTCFVSVIVMFIGRYIYISYF